MTNRPRYCILLLLPLLSVATVCRSATAYNPLVRVKLSRFFPSGTLKVAITCSTPFSVSDATGIAVVQAPTGTNYQFSDQNGSRVALTARGENSDAEDSEAGVAGLSGLCFTIRPSPGGIITVAEPAAAPHHYRGSIIVMPGLSIIDTVPLEDYLRGVLKPEIGAGAPAEALKAQAIAARTYTIHNLGKLSTDDADVDDTTRTQGYFGQDGETPEIDQAVAATAGVVLLYNGLPIDAVYCTDCGGKTGDGGPTAPYLSPVSDPECEAEPSWEVDVTQEQVAGLLGGSGTTEPLNIAVDSTDSSGRVVNVTLSQGAIQKQVSGAELRKAFGYDKLRSTLFKVSRNDDGTFKFVGQGWGHGLGMCQRGAIYLALHASKCEDILKHYYSGATLGQLDATMTAVAPRNQLVSASLTGSTRHVP